MDSIVNSVINSTDNRNSSAKKPKGGSSKRGPIVIKPWFEVNAEAFERYGSVPRLWCTCRMSFAT